MAWMIPKIDGKLASRHMEKRKEKKRVLLDGRKQKDKG